jgi:hypothetical protein
MKKEVIQVSETFPAVKLLAIGAFYYSLAKGARALQ